MPKNRSFKSLDIEIGYLVIDTVLQERADYFAYHAEYPKQIGIPRKYFRYVEKWFNSQNLHAANPEKGEEKTLYGMKVNVIDSGDFNLK